MDARLLNHFTLDSLDFHIESEFLDALILELIFDIKEILTHEALVVVSMVRTVLGLDRLVRPLDRTQDPLARHGTSLVHQFGMKPGFPAKSNTCPSQIGAFNLALPNSSRTTKQATRPAEGPNDRSGQKSGDLAQAMRQKKQVELSSGIGAGGEAASATAVGRPSVATMPPSKPEWPTPQESDTADASSEISSMRPLSRFPITLP